MPKIIYIHVPGCGGSNFAAALHLRFLGSQATIAQGQSDPTLTSPDRMTRDYEARARELRTHVAAGTSLISGHVRYDPDLHRNRARDYRFVTLLRDPVERFVSHFSHMQRAHPDPARPATLEQFLSTSEAAQVGSQYLFYFAGVTQTETPDLPAAIDRAIGHLSLFDLVGDHGDPEGFARRLRRVTHTPILKWRRDAAAEDTCVSKPLRARIEEICAPDSAIFSTALHQWKAA